MAKDEYLEDILPRC